MKTLVSVSVSGMSDRIQLLFAARGLAKKLGREFLHIWPVNGHCGANFESLFECDEPIVTPTDPWRSQAVLDLKSTPWCQVETALEPYKNLEILKFHCFKGDFDQHDFGTVIRFSNDVENKVLEFVQDMADIERDFMPITVGCHVRATDYSLKTPPLDEYFKAIKACSTELTYQPVFLACDDPSIRKIFANRYENRIMMYPTKSFDRADHEATINGAIELCLLRKCGRLVLSGYSGFSRLACVNQPQQWNEGVVTVLNNWK
jgi:hypothetical protein